MSVAAAPVLAGVVAESPAMKEVVGLVLRLAETRSPVLLEGESGTGKDLIAYWLHYGGSRRGGPFIKIHCPSIPGELLESELFGHEKGAFTDARQAKAGKIEMAAAGTLYFDQIQDLAPSLQAKLLRVVEERRFERVGGTRTIEVDVRRPQRERAQRLGDGVRDRDQLALVVAGEDQEVVREVGDRPQVERQDVLGLLVERGLCGGGYGRGQLLHR